MAEVADRHGGKAANITELAGMEAYGKPFLKNGRKNMRLSFSSSLISPICEEVDDIDTAPHQLIPLNWEGEPSSSGIQPAST